MKNLVQLGDLPNHLPNVFPSYHAAKWLYRKSGKELLETGVIIKVNRRVLFDLGKLETFLTDRKEV